MFKIIPVWIALCCVFILAACGATETMEKEASSDKDSAPTTRVITNPNGPETTIPSHPKRIVDLSGSTEELLILGKKPVATMNADYGNPVIITPTLKDQLSADTAILGWYGSPLSIEAIASENPDVIILGKDFNTDQYEALSQIAPTVTLPYSYYDWRERLSYLAITFGEEGKKER